MINRKISRRFDRKLIDTYLNFICKITSSKKFITFSGSGFSNVNICCFFLRDIIISLTSLVWSDKTSNLKTSLWCQEDCDGHHLLFLDIMRLKKLCFDKEILMLQ